MENDSQPFEQRPSDLVGYGPISEVIEFCTAQINDMFPDAGVGSTASVLSWIRSNLEPKGSDYEMIVMGLSYLPLYRRLMDAGWSPRCRCGKAIYLWVSNGCADTSCFDCVTGGFMPRPEHPEPPGESWEDSIRSGKRIRFPWLPPKTSNTQKLL